MEAENCNFFRLQLRLETPLQNETPPRKWKLCCEMNSREATPLLFRGRGLTRLGESPFIDSAGALAGSLEELQSTEQEELEWR